MKKGKGHELLNPEIKIEEIDLFNDLPENVAIPVLESLLLGHYKNKIDNLSVFYSDRDFQESKLNELVKEIMTIQQSDFTEDIRLELERLDEEGALIIKNMIKDRVVEPSKLAETFFYI